MSSRAVSFSLMLHDSKQYGLDSLVLASGNSTRAVGVAISAGRDVFGLTKTNSRSLGKRVSGGRGMCVPLTLLIIQCQRGCGAGVVWSLV